MAGWEAAPVSAPGSAKGRIIFESGDDLEDDFERSEGPGEGSGGRDHQETKEEEDRLKGREDSSGAHDARNPEQEIMSTSTHKLLKKPRSIRF